VSCVAASTFAADCPSAGAAPSIAAIDGPTLLASELALEAALSADDDRVDAGDQIGFTVTAINSSKAGTGTAQGVVIDDPLPSGTGIDWSRVRFGQLYGQRGASGPDAALHRNRPRTW